MSRTLRHIFPCAASILLAASAHHTAHAGAFFIPERGARALSLGGAFIAGANDLNAQWLNPAALIRLRGDLELYLDAGLIFSDQRFQRAADPVVERNDPAYANGFPEARDVGGPFFDPSFAIASNLGLKDWMFAFGVYGPYAGTNEWDPDGPQRYSLINLQAIAIFIQASAAWKPSEHFAVGVGLQAVPVTLMQRLKISTYPGIFGWQEQRDLDVLAQVEAKDLFSPSGNIGFLISPLTGPGLNLDIGLSAQLPVSVQADGKLKVQKPGHYYFSGTEIVGDEISLTLDFPWILRAGVMLSQPESWSFEVAAVLEMWSMFEEIRVTPGEDSIAFEDVPGIGRYTVKEFSLNTAYRDVFSVRAGGSWTIPNSGVALRAGAFFETGAPPDHTLNVLDIDGDKLGLTLGGTIEFKPFALDLAFAWVETFERTITNSEHTQINPIYLADPQPYDETGPHTIGNGTYAARNLILAATLSASF